jgi:Mrp family chromosome partitioning ATPase
MKPSKTNPFTVIRATLETDVPKPGIITISSALPGDGKTAVAAGIARSLAAGGYRTLVLDAGATPEAAPGAQRDALTLEGAHDRLNHAVRATGSGCDYLSLQDIGADVSSSVGIGALYDAIRSRYEYAVVDASVLNGDGLALARGADGVVLAVREGRAIAPADGEAVELLNRVHARFLGVVATTERIATEYSNDANLSDRLKDRVAPPLPPREATVVPVPRGVVARLRATLAPALAGLVGRARAVVPARTTPRE